MLTDLEIAQQAKIEKIIDIAKKINLKEEDLELYGNYKAKINLENVNLDKEKVEAGNKLLLEVAKEYQVIYFTCHDSRSPK